MQWSFRSLKPEPSEEAMSKKVRSSALPACCFELGDMRVEVVSQNPNLPSLMLPPNGNPFHYSTSFQDAMKFPLVGSVVLFSLFLAFKFLPKEVVNAILSGRWWWWW